MQAAPASDVSTVSASEVAKFEAMAADWWDVEGKFKPLHMMNPIRLDYITGQIAAEFGRDLSEPAPFKGLRVLDIGCGGGLMCEPMARLGAEVIGADAAEKNISVAQIHAEQSGLAIDYRATTAEALVAAGEEFDVVLSLEVIEHVSDAQAFLDACARLVRPGGLQICSTLNRTPQSYLGAIIAAERIMGWLPPGTHDWQTFVTPNELAHMMEKAQLTPVDRIGMVFNPLTWGWSLSPNDLAVNYAITARRP